MPVSSVDRMVNGSHSPLQRRLFSYQIYHTRMHTGYYLTGDNARRDKDGYYWITGRADDVVIVSGTQGIPVV